ncbi:FecCD family ABC transporter permease [Corynebacterium gerontici]|uniref:Ferric enterobactin transport system permease protein FepG n=1 Tax=Corynebacterium gerontici TaxID=2079234 RepID=A0A3G6J232_9CORY|nr:iron chelate uptake ABC transporter family permease subunit [Corynebacterium gerontici]AZA12121.1 Ferric enterobactin transport system permease protein FepG [Corynebacterium gerontici]
MSKYKLVEVNLRRSSPFLLRIAPRSVFLMTGLFCVLCALGVSALLIGDYGISAVEAVRALFGQSQDRLAIYFVQHQRAPRLIAGILVGAALGASGAIFQTLSDNPLGSPDVIGFSTGAATGALIQIILFSATPTGVAIGAMCGGLFTALTVYGLSLERGAKVGGIRLVLIGIGVSAVLHALNSLLIVRASLASAQTAALWLAGSLNAVQLDSIGFYIVVIALGLLFAFMLSRPLDALTSGDEIATAVGVDVQRRKPQLIAVGVALVAAAVAIAGPIAFVALSAPQIARRLCRSGTSEIFASALSGAVIVVGSDIAAQRVFAPTQLPVGAVTGVLGGAYLVWLLIYQTRRIR